MVVDVNKFISSMQLEKNHKQYFNISENLANVLANLVKLKKPMRVLEIGTSNGYSGLHILKELPEGAVFKTIEVDSIRAELARENFKSCGFEFVEVINSNVFDFLSVYECEERGFDFVFMDAAQKDYRKIVEILREKKMLNSGFMIVCDNVLSHFKYDYMRDFVDFMKEEEEFETQVLELDSGFLISCARF
ncbi:MAG: O-methyltransferase [Nanoarchaeota archaeon]